MLSFFTSQSSLRDSRKFLNILFGLSFVSWVNNLWQLLPPAHHLMFSFQIDYRWWVAVLWARPLSENLCRPYCIQMPTAMSRCRVGSSRCNSAWRTSHRPWNGALSQTRELGHTTVSVQEVTCFPKQNWLLKKLNLLGWHWLIKLYRFQVYNSMIHHLQIVLCVHHP